MYTYKFCGEVFLFFVIIVIAYVRLRRRLNYLLSFSLTSHETFTFFPSRGPPRGKVTAGDTVPNTGHTGCSKGQQVEKMSYQNSTATH